jgi:hypothetical protein
MVTVIMCLTGWSQFEVKAFYACGSFAALIGGMRRNR